MEANVIGVSCVEPDCFEFGWSTLISKKSEWKTYHTNLQTQDNKQDTIMVFLMIDLLADVDVIRFLPLPTSASTIPTLPTFTNPRRFIVKDTWTDNYWSVEKVEQDQKMEQFLIVQHMDKAFVMLFKERSMKHYI